MALSRPARTALLGLVVIAALALRLHQLDARSLWLDECYSLRDAAGIVPFNRMRPVYYLFLRLWLRLGDSDAWARLPSALFGTAAVYAVYRLGRDLAGSGAGLLAALLLALSPQAIDHSQQVRMYGLGLLLGLVGSLALSRSLDRPESRWVPGWAALRLLTVATAPLNATLLAADAVLVAVFLRERRAAQLRFLRWSALLLLWLPLVALGATDPSAPASVSWLAIVPRPGAEAALAALAAFSAAWPIDYWAAAPRFASAVASAAYLGFSLMLAALAAAALWPGAPPRARRAAAWCFIPLALLFVASCGPRSLWLDRYLVFASPYLLLLVAVGIERAVATRRALGAAAAAAYALALAPALIHYYRAPAREDWRAVAQAIQRAERPGDRVVVYRDFYQTALRHYYRGAVRVTGYREVPATPAGARALVASLARKPGRVWLVYARFGPPPLHAAFQAGVEAGAPGAQRQAFDGVDLYLLPDPATLQAASGAT